MKLHCAITTVWIAMSAVTPIYAQFARQQIPTNATRPSPQQNSESAETTQSDVEAELRVGTALTRRGSFAEAIPHLLAARGRVLNRYASEFNLALCYVGTGQFQQAVQILSSLRDGGHDNTDVYNLLAQAQIGNVQPSEAWTSFQKAAALTPQNEKLYLFLADSCMERNEYALGLKVVNLGIQNLSGSARLYYERAVLLSRLDQFDRGKADFELARKLAPDSDISYLAAAHEEFLQGNMSEAIHFARESIRRGYENPVLLTILGEALMSAGATPGDTEFAEAETLLQKAVAERPDDPSSRIALGKLYLMSNKIEDAIENLEKARQLDPDNASVCAHLAKAYLQHGEPQRAQEMLDLLAKLNVAKAERIRTASGDRKTGYAGSGTEKEAEDKPSRQ
jgi:predicted Zn-dependent protease